MLLSKSQTALVTLTSLITKLEILNTFDHSSNIVFFFLSFMMTHVLVF